MEAFFVKVIIYLVINGKLGRSVHLAPADFVAGRDVISNSEHLSPNAFSTEAFEGDLHNPGLDARTMEMFSSRGFYYLPAKSGQLANAIRFRYRLWPQGKVYYTISANYTAAELVGRAVIASAFMHITERSCIRITPRRSEPNYVHIHNKGGCSSSLGMTGGRQEVFLGIGCIDKQTLVHEMLHVLGFFHEQARSDRDDYVKVNLANVITGAERQFAKYSQAIIADLGTDYDYQSIMHYPSTAFSKNGNPTIQAFNGSPLGNRYGMSVIDAQEVNQLYHCGPVRGNPCENHRIECDTWKTNGYCHKERELMMVYCALSCGLCGSSNGSPVACMDHSNSCQEWSQTQQCQDNPAFMQLMCKVSCGLCRS